MGVGNQTPLLFASDPSLQPTEPFDYILSVCLIYNLRYRLFGSQNMHVRILGDIRNQNKANKKLKLTFVLICR